MVVVPGTAVFVWDRIALQPCQTEPELSSLDVT